MLPPSDPFKKLCCSFRKFEPKIPDHMVYSYDRQQNGKGGEHMAKERFVEVYSQGFVNVAKVIVDTETGVNYLLASHDLRVGTGLTVLVDQDGKPVVTPVN